jgi:hypothetical protein
MGVAWVAWGGVAARLAFATIAEFASLAQPVLSLPLKSQPAPNEHSKRASQSRTQMGGPPARMVPMPQDMMQA